MPAHARKKETEGRIARISVPPAQRKDVMALSQALGHTKRRSSRWKLEGQRGEEAVLPATVVSALEQVVEVLARGEAVTVVPVAQELTTQEAADMLNVSRQYLVRLVEEGDIPCTKTGTHRRLRVDDVLAYKRRRDRQRKKTLDKLEQLSQEYGGYDELR
jgi:excisionase family DNA binding protein